MYQSSFFPPIVFVFLSFSNTFFNLSRFIIFVTKIRGSRIESKIVWRDSADLNVGWVSIKVKWRNAKTRNFFILKKIEKNKGLSFHLYFYLNDYSIPKNVTLNFVQRKKKKTMSFCGHNFTLECWKCWLFLRQDCGKGKPWNQLANFAK